MMCFQSGVFYEGSLCPALIVTEPKLPILVVAPGIHRTWRRPYDDVSKMMPSCLQDNLNSMVLHVLG